MLSFVQARMGAAQESLDSVFTNRYGLDLSAAQKSRSTQTSEEPTVMELEIPDSGSLAECYRAAGGDPDALLKLMEAEHAKMDAK